MKILLLDSNHPLITEQLLAKGFVLEEDFTSSYDEVLQKINQYDGIIIRSRIPLDKNNHPVAIPELIPQSDVEKARFDAALRRKELSLILSGKMKAQDSIELKKLFG